ncbi:hypothetical protein EKO04_004786 [Ascochyta lentis]|uniref:Uncharacterized protein n=1 Tax=Ascochyta lentis TaxID=205686 RepID=A0A8H7J5G6_9PLEO|nr:hypothetical protein EKO04_004786 [Ascochyta lentis]
MVKVRVSELLETLGLRNHSTSGYQARPVFHYEPLLKLYKLEIPSLFGVLLRDEGVFLDRADPNLFDAELEDLLTELGPLIWPLPGQGLRDHLLNPVKGSRYPADLMYPRDSTLLKGHLRNLILSKRARPDIDISALIEKRHKDANLKIFSNPQSDHTDTRPSKARKKLKETANEGEGTERSRKVSLTEENSSLTEAVGASSSASEDSVVDHSARRDIRAKSASGSFQAALRLYRKCLPDELEYSKPSHFYGTSFLTDDLNSADKCFASICQHIDMDCTYMEFHPPEDMSLEGSIRIDRRSHSAEVTFQRVATMLREARKFPGEPSYRTIEVEVGSDILSEG